jgi:hypothetical protein
MARALPAERDRILVKLSLPRDALIEFAIRCWLGLGVESVLPAIRHLPQRRAANRCDALGAVVAGTATAAAGASTPACAGSAPASAVTAERSGALGASTPW